MVEIMKEEAGDEGVTSRSLKFYDKNKQRLGKLYSVEGRSSKITHPGPHFYLIFAKEETRTIVHFTGLNCGYGGEGPHGLTEILSKEGFFKSKGEAMDYVASHDMIQLGIPGLAVERPIELVLELTEGEYNMVGHLLERPFRDFIVKEDMDCIKSALEKWKKARKMKEESLLNPKWVVIHGEGTIYNLSIFKFGGDDHEFLRDRAGFGEGRKYIGAIVWSNRPKFIYDNPGGYPPDALRKAGLLGPCSVLELGWKTILNRFDEIPDGSTIRVELNITAKEFYETSKVEIVKGWER